MHHTHQLCLEAVIIRDKLIRTGNVRTDSHSLKEHTETCKIILYENTEVIRQQRF